MRKCLNCKEKSNNFLKSCLICNKCVIRSNNKVNLNIKVVDKIFKAGCHISMIGDLYAMTNGSNMIMKAKQRLLYKQADKESRQLEIIKNSLMIRFKIDEIEALTKGLDILEDLKKGEILK
jgi:hypothetical protein